MPQAAWCSGCQRYVWVTPEGQCENGHGPEFLTAYYDSLPTPADEPAAPGSLEPATAPTAAPSTCAVPALTPDLTHHMWVRLFAFAIDYALAAVGALGLAYVTGATWRLATHLPATSGLKTFAQLEAVVVLYAYFIVSEGVLSTTLGKGLFGLRVRGAASGTSITWKQSFVRNVSLIVDLLFFGLVGVLVAQSSPWRQRFGDRTAGTVVVRSDAPELAVAVATVDKSAIDESAALPIPTEPLQPHKVAGWVVWSLIGIAVLFAATIGFAAWTAFAPNRPARNAPTQRTGGSPSGGSASIDITGSVDASAQAAVDAGADSAPAAKTAVHVAKTTNPNVPAPALDAFIAAQYPGYRVAKRISFPDQYEPGRLGLNYLLVNKREPRFTLLVSVTELKPDETADDFSMDQYVDTLNRVATNDDVFSVWASRQYPQLAGDGQDAIIRAFVAQKPSKDAIAFDGLFDDTSGIDFDVNGGAGALDRSMQAYTGGGDWSAHATVPKGPRHSVVHVTVENQEN